MAIIDDDEHVLAAIARLLRMHGYEVCTFSTAEAFLASPQLSHTSCVVSDLRLPGMHGMKLLELLRGRQKQIPLIFITAHPEDISRRRHGRIDAVCVLKKPFDSDRLFDCLSRALGPRP